MTISFIFQSSCFEQSMGYIIPIGLYWNSDMSKGHLLETDSPTIQRACAEDVLIFEVTFFSYSLKLQ